MAWGVVYYRAPDGSIPAEEFLDACPTKVEATILAVLEAVRSAPPPQFSGTTGSMSATSATTS